MIKLELFALALPFSRQLMRIYHLGKFYPPAPGGMETYIRTLAQAQARLGCQVTVLCMNHEAGGTRTEQDGDIEVIRFRRSVSIAKMDYCSGLISTLSALKAEAIHVHVPNPTMITALLAANTKVPIFVTYQSDVVRQKIRSLCFRPLEYLFYRKVSAIFATSREYANHSKILRKFAQKVSVVPLAIRLAPYVSPSVDHLQKAQQIRAQLQGPLWLCCGRLIYYKGLDIAIRALRSVPGTLIIVGSGPEENRLVDLARELGVVDRTLFVGQVPSYLDTIPYYLAADALWFPSNQRSEAFGLVQAEAMACSRPVINTHIEGSGVSWVSLNEKTGLTIPKNDPEALAQAAIRLSSNTEFRRKLGETAKARAIELFDDEQMARMILCAYAPSLPEQLHVTSTHWLPDQQKA